MAKHAFLSASSAHRWLECLPSAKACEGVDERASPYAKQGTDCHELCVYLVEKALGRDAEDPTENLDYYDQEMQDCAEGYCSYVMEQVEEVKKLCPDPQVMVEQRLDFSRWVEEGFGTGDCVIVANDVLQIIDYKHGLGVLVSAEMNPQMMCYALGAVELFDGIYDIREIRMTIYQPRRENVSTFSMTKGELLTWAYEGKGEFKAGDHCQFCKVKATCRKRAEYYYGIYDETDYSSLHLVKGHYDEKELNETYIGNVKRYDLIYKYYMKYRSRRVLGFCCSRQHAEEMAKEFCKRGIESVAVYSNADGEFSEDRDKAIEKLKNQEIRVIFSVDMFNEGVDIAALDMVLFLRPTDSPVVFLQQLGRGLRVSKGKEYLNVLDFIGNYEKAGRAPLLLRGGKHFEGRAAYDYSNMEYPDDCIVDFDMRLIDLFRELDKKSLSVRERIRQEFYRVKELLDGKVPTRMELFAYMDDDIEEKISFSCPFDCQEMW